MLCYRDMTFCPYWKTCKDGMNCFRKADKKLATKAKEFGLPLCLWATKPECYIKIKVRK